MSVFADSSALVALLDANDDYHEQAAVLWASLAQQRESLITTNYVIVETVALVQRRWGLKAVRELQQEFLPLISVEWVKEAEHQAGLEVVIAAGRKDLSFVDCVSFAVMRRMGIRRCFTFDAHFKEMGFEPLR
jgi:predicted nucleic acid-binding protein